MAASCSRRSASGSRPGADTVAVAAPQNQPIVGQIVDRDEVRDAALSRVEVTQLVLEAFEIESVGAVMDPDPSLALDDAVRAFQPSEVLLSALYETRFGLTRKDLVEWAKEKIEVPVTHIPVRVDDDAVRWDVVHTLLVGTQTIASPDLIRQAEGARRGEAPPLHDHLPALRRPQPRAGLRATRAAPWPSSTGPTSTPPASR